MWRFRDHNGPFVLNKIILVQTMIIPFIYLLALFILRSLKKNLTVDPELWGCTVFGPKIIHLPQTKNFLEKLYHLDLPIGPFHCAKFLKNLTVDPELRGSAIHFSEKTVNRPYSFHSRLSTCHKSVRYWSVNEIYLSKNTEISLAKSHFGFNLRTRFFPSMQFSQNVNEP